MTRWLCLAAIALLGCGSSRTIQCKGYTLNHIPVSSAQHIACDGACGNGVNPPTGGDHCPTPLSCLKFDTAQPRCQWVHNLEHGHAVLAYNCPEAGGCPDIVTALDAIYDAHGASPRILVTPDPLLPSRVAGIVWGYSFTADTVEPDEVDCLLQHQDEEAPEAGLACY